jgi:hypothetical protein
MRYGEPYYPKGIDIVAEDWDILVVLDACRYDYFKEEVDFDGELSSITSRGSTSSEFMRGNFSEKQLHNTIYISANGFYGALRDELRSSVYKHVDLYSEEWRDEYGISTNPNTVTKKALDISREYPNKRLIIHYLQPHQPYLGEFGREKFVPGGNLRESIENSDVSSGDVKKAYRENLNLVLDEVKILLDELDGKTVISSDHGEMLGERKGLFRYYGHFDGVYWEELVQIPWYTVKSGPRREIIAEDPEQTEEVDEEEIEDNLRALGYKI